ncbi:YceI family protein [Gilvibacter sp.]|uniref:YceI family protein n=1 Tax=Gilvibacter sp. TaxID=2729997 RepID=UPI0025B9B1E4|nr:YceI family protein [Gilvibacter sp.]NQX78584.1 YceI family protein [Gilvibacter sp.]
MKKLVLALCLLMGMAAQSQMDERLTYLLDTERSLINWRGYYAFKFSEHKGTVNFRSGELRTDGGAIVGGSFVIDMNSISNRDYLEGNGPVEHLKDEDFFFVKKFPFALLEIETVEYFPEENKHKFIATLTIKGVSNQQEFWGVADGDALELRTQFKIDRTRWGITYNNDLKDHAIAEAIEFDVYLKFKAQ